MNNQANKQRRWWGDGGRGGGHGGVWSASGGGDVDGCAERVVAMMDVEMVVFQISLSSNVWWGGVGSCGGVWSW